MIRGITTASLILFMSQGTFGQSGPVPLTFEAASIKPSTTSPALSFDFSPGADRLAATKITLGGLVMMAYTVTPRQVSGQTSLLSEAYDIEAKAERAVSRDSMSRMLQTLLMDRFKLTFHRETMEASFYALVVGNGGPKLRQSEGRALSSPFRAGSKESGHLIGQHESMSDFALMLSTISEVGDRVVIDKTGLKGNYDFDLAFTPRYATNVVGPSIFTALKEQLGLNLESQDGLVEFLIIDHVERPTQN